MMGMMMAGRELGPGERIDRRNRRRKLYFIAGAGIFGGVLGGIVGGLNAHQLHGFAPEALRLPPMLALIIAVGLALGMAGLPVYGFRLVDEVKVQRSLRIMTASCLAVLGGYPAWQALAAGGWLGQPTAFGVFALGYGAMIIAAIALKIRG